MNTKKIFFLSLFFFALAPAALLCSSSDDSGDVPPKEGYFKRFFHGITFNKFRSNTDNSDEVDVNEIAETAWEELLQSRTDSQNNEFDATKLAQYKNLQEIIASRQANDPWRTTKHSAAKTAGEQTVKGLYEGSKFALNQGLEWCGYYTPQRKAEIKNQLDQEKQTLIAKASKYIELANLDAADHKKKQRYLIKAEDCLNKADILDDKLISKKQKNNFDLWVQTTDGIAQGLDLFDSPVTTQVLCVDYFNYTKNQIEDLEKMLADPKKFDEYIKKQNLTYAEVTQMVTFSLANLETSILSLPVQDDGKDDDCKIGDMPSELLEYINTYNKKRQNKPNLQISENSTEAFKKGMKKYVENKKRSILQLLLKNSLQYNKKHEYKMS